MQRVDDWTRRSLGRRDDEPRVEFVTGHARLGDGGQLGHGGIALRARHGEGPHAAGFHVADFLRDVAEGDAPVAGDETLVGGPAARELQGDYIDAREQVEELAGDMRIGAYACRRVEDLAR